MLRRLLVLASASLACTPGVAAAAPPPITLDAGVNAGEPNVAVADDGTAHIAWIVSVPGGSDIVRYCRLPRTANTCSATMSWTPDNQFSYDAPIPLVRTNGTIQIVVGRGPVTPRTFLMESTTGGTSFAAIKQIGNIETRAAAAGPGLSAITGYAPTDSPTGFDRVQVMATNIAAPGTTASAAFAVNGLGRTANPAIGFVNPTTPVFAYTEEGDTWIRQFNSTKSGYNNGLNWADPVKVPGEDLVTLVSRNDSGAFLMTHTELEGNALKDVHVVRQINDNNGGLTAPIIATEVGAPQAGTLSLGASGTLTSVWDDGGDPSSVRASTAAPGGAFSGPGTLVDEASVYGLRAATAPDRGGLAVWDGNGGGPLQAARIPVGGPVLDPLPTPVPGATPPPATPVPTPGSTPVILPAGCKLTIKPGIVASARGGVSGCWVRDGKSEKYSYDGTVDINGVVFTAPAGQKTGVEVDLAAKTVKAPKGTQQKAGSVILSSDKVSWNFATSNTQKFVDLQHAAAGKAIRLLGFAVTGEATLTFGDGVAHLQPYLQMPFPFDALTASTSVLISQQEGLVLEGASFDITNAMIGPIEVKLLHVDALDGLGNFKGTAKVRLPGSTGDIDVIVGFEDGSLSQFAATVRGTAPFPLPITPVVHITGVGFNYQDDATGFTVGGGAELAFPTSTGPFWFDGIGSPPGTGGGFNLHVPKGTKEAIITIGGRFKFGLSHDSRFDFGGLTSTYNSQANTFELHVDAQLGNRTLGVLGRIDGEVNMNQNVFYLRGKLEACLLACIAKLDTVVSSTGVAVCTELGYDPFVLRLLVGYYWKTGFDVGASCDLGPYIPGIFRGQPDEPQASEPATELVAADVIALPPKISPADEKKYKGEPTKLVDLINKTSTASVEVKGNGGLPAIELTEVTMTGPQEQPNGTIKKSEPLPYAATDRVIASSDLTDLEKPIQAGDVVMVPNNDPTNPSVRITFVQRGKKLTDQQSSNLPEAGLIRIRNIGGAAVKFGLAEVPGQATRLQSTGGILVGRSYAPTTVKARLSGTGRTRTLTWDATGLGASGRSIDFTEESTKGGFQVIRSTKAAKGSVRFKIADGPAGKRTINAVVKNSDDLPVDTRKVATYRAPGPALPGRATRLRFSLSKKGALKASWGGNAGAAQILVTVKVADGRQFQIRTKKRSVVIPGVAKTEKVAVTVVGLTKSAQSGPAVTAKRGR